MKKPIIYISSASGNFDRVKVHAARAERIGFTALPWLEALAPDCLSTMSNEEWLARAKTAAEAVRACDVLWMVSPRARFFAGGAFAELGLALGLGKEVYLSGKGTHGIPMLARCYPSARFV